jgi:tRNA(Ile)-lysidine synthase
MVALMSRLPRSKLLERMIQVIRERQLFVPGQHLLVAVSGGPDSIALLTLLERLAPAWHLKLTALHVNYRLRGTESDGDESFVAEFCRQWQIPLRVVRQTLMRRPKQSSLQALAREARYEAMKAVAREVGAARIAVGHTADDQAETILLWMLRGAGLRGLAGMPFVREGTIIRPLLSTTRTEIIEFLGQEGLPYREDSSNKTGDYRRNRIRKELMPAVKKLAPAAVRVLQRQADLLREDEEYLESVTRECWKSLVESDSNGGCWLDRVGFSELPSALQRRLIREILQTFEPEGRAAAARVVEAVRRLVLHGAPNSRLCLRRLAVKLCRDRLHFGRNGPGTGEYETLLFEHEEAVTVAVPSTVYWARSNTYFHVQVIGRDKASSLTGNSWEYQAIFDADLVTPPLMLRSWRTGDRFCPLGMNGQSKKLQDLFTDLKIPRHRRKAIPILEAPEGILWVAGVRRDGRFIVRDTTERCLVVTMSQKRVEEGDG